MNRMSQECGLVLDKIEQAKALNKLVSALIAAKGSGQDLIIGDAEAMGFILVLEQLGIKLDEAANSLGEYKKAG